MSGLGLVGVISAGDSEEVSSALKGKWMGKQAHEMPLKLSEGPSGQGGAHKQCTKTK